VRPFQNAEKKCEEGVADHQLKLEESTSDLKPFFFFEPNCGALFGAKMCEAGIGLHMRWAQVMRA